MLGFGRVLAKSQHVRNRRQHEGRVQRLGQDIEQVSLLPGILERPLVPGCPEKRRNWQVWITGLQENRELDAVHARKHHVDDRQVRMPVFQHLQRLLGRINRARLVPARRENHRQRVSDGRLVINNQNLACPRYARHVSPKETLLPTKPLPHFRAADSIRSCPRSVDP